MAPYSTQWRDSFFVFEPDSTVVDGVVRSAYGFIPFVGGMIHDGINGAFGHRRINKEDSYSRLQSKASLVLDTVSQAENVAKYGKIVGGIGKALSSVGKIAGVMSNILTIVDMGVSASKANEIGFDSMVDKLLGRGLSSNSHEGVSMLYAYASIRMEQLIKDGDVSYTTDEVGGIESYSCKNAKVDAVLDELKILRTSIGADPDEIY